MARRVVLLGPPGCGKGTYAKHLTKLLSAFHISTGDLMRAEIGAGTELGKELESHTSRGQLVPDSLLFDLLDPILQKHDAFVADGFPRTVAQAAALGERCRIDRVVSITMREDALVRKLLGRRVCPVCNISYNVAHIDEDNFYMPAVLPDNPECSCYKRLDRLVRREDDREDVIMERLRVYHTETAPVLQHYEEMEATHGPVGLIRKLDIIGGSAKMVPLFEEAVT